MVEQCGKVIADIWDSTYLKERMIPNRLSIVAALMLVMSACSKKKNDAPSPPQSTVSDRMNKMAGKYFLQGQSFYQCWQCTPEFYDTGYSELHMYLYVVDDATIALTDTNRASTAWIMHLLTYDTAMGIMYFASPDNSPYLHKTLNYYLGSDSIVYDEYSEWSGRSNEQIVHTP